MVHLEFSFGWGEVLDCQTMCSLVLLQLWIWNIVSFANFIDHMIVIKFPLKCNFKIMPRVIKFYKYSITIKHTKLERKIDAYHPEILLNQPTYLHPSPDVL